MPTYPNLDFQNFYETTLSNDLAIGAADVFLTVVPTPTEGFITIDPEGANPEIIWYSSKTSSKVVCPAGGRGFDGTTAQAWTSGTKVIMAPVAETQRQIIDAASTLTSTVTAGWITPSQTVGSIAYNGNRSYDLTMSADVSATLSAGMRIKTTRTVAAPTQCTNLNGSTQYFSKTTPTGISFTSAFTIIAWIKRTDYDSENIVSRIDAGIDNGFTFGVTSSGQIDLYGYNTDNDNSRRFTSRQSIPLNRWVHVAVVWGTGGVGTMYIDGVSVPLVTATNGTAPTSITQGTGTLYIGSVVSGERWAGKIAQVGIFSAALSQATIRSYISQSLVGNESNLVSGYTLSNSLNDLNTTNANNLTASGSATTTEADSPFGGQADGTISSTLDYGIITKVATSTLTVQVPEGCTIPTTGGVSDIQYSTQKSPYRMPIDPGKWQYAVIFIANLLSSSVTSTTPVNLAGLTTQVVTLPVGVWYGSIQGTCRLVGSTAVDKDLIIGLSTASATIQSLQPQSRLNIYLFESAALEIRLTAVKSNASFDVSSATQYYLVGRGSGGGTLTSLGFNGSTETPAIIMFDLALL